MKNQYHYATVSEALAILKSQGYTVDFNLTENNITCGTGKFSHDEFTVVDVYRYEGNTDPADEATVYAIASKTGVKGVLATGYGFSDEDISGDMLKKFKI